MVEVAWEKACRRNVFSGVGGGAGVDRMRKRGLK